MNVPFSSNNSNIYTESKFTHAPAQLMGQNVLISQEQQRNLWDQLNTQIVPMDTQIVPMDTQNWVQLNKEPIPGGVLFSYNSPSHQTPINNFSNLQSNVWNEIQNNGLKALQYLEAIKRKPFDWNFHMDKSTSSTDLAQISKGTADFTNICGVNPFNPYQNERRKLVLKENSTSTPNEKHVIESMQEKDRKQVKFSPIKEEIKENSPITKGIQCSLCRCDEYRSKSSRRRRFLWKKSDKSATNSEDESEDSESECTRKSTNNHKRRSKSDN